MPKDSTKWQVAWILGIALFALPAAPILGQVTIDQADPGVLLKPRQVPQTQELPPGVLVEQIDPLTHAGQARKRGPVRQSAPAQATAAKPASDIEHFDISGPAQLPAIIEGVQLSFPNDSARETFPRIAVSVRLG